MKCPFCQQELSYWGMDTWYCANCAQTKFSRGNRELWQELIRTRKALEVAKEGLKEIQDKGEYVNPIELAESYLDEITALEQAEQNNHFANASKKVEQKDVK